MKLAYTAYDEQGKTVNGTIESTDTMTATETLRRQGLFVSDIGESLKDKLPTTNASRGRATGNLKSVAVLTRQLQVLLASGTPLVDAMSALIRQTKAGPWRTTLEGLRQAVEEGHSLTEAMENYPGAFDDIYLSLVSAGESSGQLPEMLERVAIYKQKQMHVRNNVIGAMIYPSMLICLALSMLSLLLLFIVPRFSALFATLDVPLPTSTQVLVALSSFYRQWWWVLAIFVMGGIYGIVAFLSTKQGRAVRDRFTLKVPYLGKIIKSFATARIVRLLSVLMASHVPLLKALDLIRNCSGNIVYSELVQKAEDMVAKGEPLHVAFNDPELISPSVHEAIRSGEATGQIDQLMGNMADFLEDDNETIVRSLTTLIEPIILIFMGVIVSIIAVSMFLPLFDLTAMTSNH